MMPLLPAIHPLRRLHAAVRAGLALILLGGAGGCASALVLVETPLHGGAPAPFGGTMLDAIALSGGGEGRVSVPLRIAAGADLPLSLGLDAAVSPITVPAFFASRDAPAPRSRAGMP